MISVDEARARLLSLVAPLDAEIVPLRRAGGRVLAREVRANRSQPPFPASAMDGYAVADASPTAGTRFRVVGESAAGHPFPGHLGAGEAVRIFTGAIVPDGAARVLIQEDIDREGDTAILRDGADDGPHIRPAGGDFEAGFRLPAPRLLGARDLALIAAMGQATVDVARRPQVALIATGDELRPPGTDLAPGEIVASNSFALAAMLEAAGAEVRLLPIARDTPESLATMLDLAAGVDLVITTGGASVGEHDLVADAVRAAGVALDFQKVAMRPGKPLMAGRGAGHAFVGLPGNPVSSVVCTIVFILPMIRRMLDLDTAPVYRDRCLTAAVSANGPRAHYMRANVGTDGGVAPSSSQDSSLLRVLAEADCLIVRDPHSPAARPGDMVRTIDLPG